MPGMIFLYLSLALPVLPGAAIIADTAAVDTAAVAAHAPLPIDVVEDMPTDVFSSTTPTAAARASTSTNLRGDRKLFGVLRPTNVGAVWKAPSSCAWICKQGWWWQRDAYAKPACCMETKDSGSPYDTCQFETCSCDASCRDYCNAQ